MVLFGRAQNPEVLQEHGEAAAWREGRGEVTPGDREDSRVPPAGLLLSVPGPECISTADGSWSCSSMTHYSRKPAAPEPTNSLES